MNSNAPFSVDRDDRLAEALDAYLAAQEAGTPPDMDEFLARYPELAGELRDCLASLAFIRRAGNLSVAGETADEEEAAGGELGDFRIVREVGRGGMGVVYEAEQISLRRRVALKVLPFAATMDPRHLQRFHNEAQAAACLHHTNIVPVFSVGCERGVHFYAMQFIDGQTLSDIIRQLCRAEKNASAEEEQTIAYPPAPEEAASTPPVAALTPLSSHGHRSRDYYRKVAELGVQAAEALDHAHQLGIVHRDIKPANLLLDGRGSLWVTDFGLAHMQQGEANLTLTGQMVGTPRYMSPEQALAKRVPIDHRTDVYSLGVTLYELLALRPAFASEDRHELLRQIVSEEPTKPRRLERAIPAELEIIILKAIEKRPQDRYATAQEMAIDLRHWMEYRPIRARRPSWVQVTRKWMRRHRSAVWAAASLLLILMIVVAGNALWWMQQQTDLAKKQAAAEMEAAEKRIAAETEARGALHEAQRWQQDERWSEALGAIRRAQAVLRGSAADRDLRQQVDEWSKDLEMGQRLEAARLLPTALKNEHFDYKSCISANAEAFAWYGLDVEHQDVDAAAAQIRSRSIYSQLVAALDFWAMIGRDRMGNWRHLFAVVRAADPDPWRNKLRKAQEQRDSKAMNALLASAEVDKLPLSTLRLLGNIYAGQENVEVQRLAALLRQAQQRQPADFWINHDLARLLMKTKPPRVQEAIGYFRVAIALRPQSSAVHFNFGGDLHDKGLLDTAIAEYREAIRLKSDYATAHLNLGVALYDKGQLDEAIAEYREAIRLMKDYADAHNNLGNALREKGQSDEALVEFREAIRLKKGDADAHNNLGNALRDKGQLDEAIAEYREAIRLKKHSPVPHSNLGTTLRDKGQLDEAIAEYREAIRLKKDFAEAYCNLGLVLELNGQFAEALENHRHGHELGVKNPRWPHPSVQWVRKCERRVELDDKLTAILSGKKQPADNAERLVLAQLCQMPYKQLHAAASRFYHEAFADQPQLADDLNAQHRYNAACAAALASCGQGKDADKLDAKERARLRQQARDWLRADLRAYRQVLEKSAGKAGPEIAQRMQHWLQDTDFAGVRGDDALAKLPADERSAWRKLWADVGELLAKVQGKKPVEKKSDTKK